MEIIKVINKIHFHNFQGWKRNDSYEMICYDN